MITKTKKELYDNETDWLEARGIGGSDASAICELSKWKSKISLWKRLVLGTKEKVKSNKKMQGGKNAEQHIRELFIITHDNYISKYIRPPKRKYWLFRRKDYPLITCTPDGLFNDNLGRKMGHEIKFIDLIKADEKAKWENNILPNDYYLQCLHYLIAKPDLDGVVLTACLQYYKHNDITNEWEYDYSIIRDYIILKENVSKDVCYLESKEIEFISLVEKKEVPSIRLK